ncbi:TRAP transporter permease [Oribacterium sp. WCC10]|uniref:TRAP transporter permease n=1 Tax=Oribacterium sp. WCC10 TaxID=1855343 RepID=UPI0008E34822|nr:TRAP transporter permease [Oribacterium sp. WCC10]SFG38327.1 TRAP transporter, 4TM/12TM fusion protein [Oribacterium sp. WCC10]
MEERTNNTTKAVDVGKTGVMAQPAQSAEAQAAVDEIMKKYDRESNTRQWKGVPDIVIKAALAVFSLFMIYMNLFAVWDERIRRPLFVGIVILFIFILFPAGKNHKAAQKVNYIPFYDVILALIGSGSFFYFVINNREIINHATRINQTEIILGVIGIVVLAECCRRVTGIPIVVVASLFVIYAFTTGASLRKIVYNLFYTTTGVIGTPIGVCSTYIVLFIIFGAFLEATGISDFFIQCANALAGSATGGPAKVSVISSALCGMVSGSSVGNTVTTGSVTIPMMKDTGFPGDFAGAVEAASSTGGQIMPPIMGAAAFLMAEMIGVRYSDIVVRAILPAILYFTGIFLMVHLRAKRLGLKGIPKENLPKWKDLLPRIYLLIPLVALIYLICAGYTMSRAAIIATVLCIVVSMFDKNHRMSPKDIFNALVTGAKNTLSIAAACGIAGIIAGVVTMTGLGQVFISAIVGVSHGNLLIALFLTMICCIILGMGVPTTATYIIMATTCAPILTTGMGLNALSANMFVFYFGIVADITPPVALAAYAGSAIAKADPMKTAVNATRLAIGAFLVPYIFSLNPAMLLINTNGIGVVMIVITSFIGMFAISAALEGYTIRPINMVTRIICAVAGLMMLYPGTVTDIIGIVIIAAIIGMEIVQGKGPRKAEKAA